MLTRGRSSGCFDNVGGIKRVYLFRYERYPIFQLSGLQDGELTDFPPVNYFAYDIQGGSFTEGIVNDENGVKFEQTLTFTLTKQDRDTTAELDRIQKSDVRFVVVFNNGDMKMGGCVNGAKLIDYNIDSGSSKASLNGYKLTFTAVEEYSAPIIRKMNPIDPDAGFLLLEDGNFVLQENYYYIKLENN